MAYREAESSYHTALHSHNCYQFYGLLRGNVDMQIDDRTHELGPGQCIIVPPDLMRAPSCAGRAPRYLIAMFDIHDFGFKHLCDGPMILTEAMLAQMDLLISDLQEPDLGNALQATQKRGAAVSKCPLL